MKSTLTTWKWSLQTAFRSPLALLALAAIVVAWVFGAYQWLWFPTEGSALALVVGTVWALAQFVVLAGFITSSVRSATEAAESGVKSIGLRSLVRFSSRQLLNCIGFLIAASLLVWLLRAVFHRADHYGLEVASFLTFQREKPVSPKTVGKVFRAIQLLIWIVALGFLLGVLCTLLQQGWREALRRVPRLLANACWRGTFLTSLLSLLVFGGLAYLLATWHPKVSSGFADYAQLVLRLGGALFLAVLGWLFWVLSIARLNWGPGQRTT